MDDLTALVKVLEQGGVVACPTETWLGLLADAHDEEAIEKVAVLKGRPADMPIALLLPSFEAAAEVALRPSRQAQALMAAHWPGPLTVLLRAKPGLSPRLVRDGKVGVRVPGASRRPSSPARSAMRSPRRAPTRRASLQLEASPSSLSHLPMGSTERTRESHRGGLPRP